MQLKYCTIMLIVLFNTSCNGQHRQIDSKLSEEDSREILVDKRIDPLNRNPSDVVTFGLLDKEGNMWFTTLTEGIYKYDGTTFVNFTTKDGLCSDKVNSAIQDKNGLLWFATAKGLCSYDGVAFVNVPLPKESPQNVCPETGLPSRETEEVLSLIQDKKGDLWLGTIAKGAYHFDGKKFTSFLKFKGRIQPDNVYNNVIQSIVEDKAGNIWFTSQTHGGISRYDGKEFTHFTKENGLPDDMIFSSFKDNNGDLWFGTLDGGLISYKEESFKYYNEKDGLCNNMVSSFYQDKTGKLLIGSFRESTVCWFDGKVFTPVPFDKNQNLLELRFITADKDGSIWFGGRYGLLWKYDGRVLKDFTQLKKAE